MTRIPDDKFRVFISHKHEDHEFATTVAKSLQSVSTAIECFVSGSDISTGTDWNHEIREALKRSHLLVLLFTNPTQNWDWCLYEAGLFTRLDEDYVHAVVSLFHPDGSPPRVRANLQGVPATQVELLEFLENLCKSTWRVSDDWRKGPLNSRVRPELLQAAAAQIVRAFPSRREAAAVLRAAIAELDEAEAAAATKPAAVPGTRTVFIVHGHRMDKAREVARAVEQMTGLETVILHEKPNKGRTVIEKFEHVAASSTFAVALWTADDLGGTSQDLLTSRARQNVVLETGWFAGHLGRARVLVLLEPAIEMPSDFLGLVCEPLVGDTWRERLRQELAASSIDSTRDLDHQ